MHLLVEKSSTIYSSQTQGKRYRRTLETKKEMTGTHNNRKRDAEIVQHAPIPPKLLFVPQLRQPIFIFDIDWDGLLHSGREDEVIYTRQDGQKARSRSSIEIRGTERSKARSWP